MNGGKNFDDNIHVAQDYSAISNESIHRTNIGHLDYKIQISKPEYIIGEQVQFQIIPTNPGLVFSRLKYCTVRHSDSNELKYDLYWQNENNYCKDKIIDFNILTPLDNKYNIKAVYNAFNWNQNTTNSFGLYCDLELSINPFDQNQPITCQK